MASFRALLKRLPGEIPPCTTTSLDNAIFARWATFPRTLARCNWTRCVLQAACALIKKASQKKHARICETAYLKPSPSSMQAKGRSNSRVISSGTAVMLMVPMPIVRRGNAKKSVAEKEEAASRPSAAVSRTRLRCRY